MGTSRNQDMLLQRYIQCFLVPLLHGRGVWLEKIHLEGTCKNRAEFIVKILIVSLFFSLSKYIQWFILAGNDWALYWTFN